MSNQAEGVVQRVHFKPGREGTAVAGKMLWSLCIDDIWYSTFTTQPACNEGDKVAFSFQTNERGFHNVDKNTLTVVERNAVAASPPKASGNGAAKSTWKGGERESYWKEKGERDIETQKRISWHGSLNTAVEIIKAGRELGVTKIGMDGKTLGTKPTYEQFREVLWLVARDVHSGIEDQITFYENAEQETRDWEKSGENLGNEGGESGDPF